MTFINWNILFGLFAVSIPILIHLFNRRKAKFIDWGAMQFLLGSLVNRKRRILVEELILMVLRCLLVAVRCWRWLGLLLPSTAVFPGLCCCR